MKMKMEISVPREVLCPKSHVAVVLFLALSTAAILAGVRAEGADRTGKEVVDSICSTCHGAGLNGAPKIGDSEAWSQRASQGLSSLTQHALDGIRTMPAHGGSQSLSKVEIVRAVTWMVNESGGNWVEPLNLDSSAAQRQGYEVVNAQCANCHLEGLGGAPKIGDLQAWAPRIKHGIPYLVSSAIHGHGGMPPRGGQANLTDAELNEAVLYMLNPASARHQSSSGAPANVDRVIDPNHKFVGGIEIYLGIVSAESIRAWPAASAERSMHGGVPKGPDNYHVNASLFDEKSEVPVTNAQVRLTMVCARQDTLVIDLEAMMVGGGGSYGGYVHAHPGIPCSLTLRINRSTAEDAVDAKFTHTFD